MSRLEVQLREAEWTRASARRRVNKLKEHLAREQRVEFVAATRVETLREQLRRQKGHVEL